MRHFAMSWESNHGKDEDLQVLEHKRMSLYEFPGGKLQEFHVSFRSISLV